MSAPSHLHRAPADCPVCGERLAVSRLGCPGCGTERRIDRHIQQAVAEVAIRRAEAIYRTFGGASLLNTALQRLLGVALNISINR